MSTPRRRHLLVVDFEPDNVRWMTEFLEAAGYRVDVAEDGMKALEMFHTDRPDGVVVEAMIPKKSGGEVCKAIKSDPERSATPVVITTGIHRGPNYRERAIASFLCDEYLERPFDQKTMLGTLSRLLPADELPAEARADAADLAATQTLAPPDAQNADPAATQVVPPRPPAAASRAAPDVHAHMAPRLDGYGDALEDKLDGIFGQETQGVTDTDAPAEETPFAADALPSHTAEDAASTAPAVETDEKAGGDRIDADIDRAFDSLVREELDAADDQTGAQPSAAEESGEAPEETVAAEGQDVVWEEVEVGEPGAPADEEVDEEEVAGDALAETQKVEAVREVLDSEDEDPSGADEIEEIPATIPDAGALAESLGATLLIHAKELREAIEAMEADEEQSERSDAEVVEEPAAELPDAPLADGSATVAFEGEPEAAWEPAPAQPADEPANEPMVEEDEEVLPEVTADGLDDAGYAADLAGEPEAAWEPAPAQPAAEPADEPMVEEDEGCLPEVAVDELDEAGYAVDLAGEPPPAVVVDERRPRPVRAGPVMLAVAAVLAVSVALWLVLGPDDGAGERPIQTASAGLTAPRARAPMPPAPAARPSPGEAAPFADRARPAGQQGLPEESAVSRDEPAGPATTREQVSRSSSKTSPRQAATISRPLATKPPVSTSSSDAAGSTSPVTPPKRAATKRTRATPDERPAPATSKAAAEPPPAVVTPVAPAPAVVAPAVAETPDDAASADATPASVEAAVSPLEPENAVPAVAGETTDGTTIDEQTDTRIAAETADAPTAVDELPVGVAPVALDPMPAPDAGPPRGQSAQGTADVEPFRPPEEEISRRDGEPASPGKVALGLLDPAGAPPPAPPAPQRPAGREPETAEVPKPSVVPGTLVDLLRVDTVPTAVTTVTPEYPRLARSRGREGRVLVQVLVGPEGTVEDAKIVSSAGRIFDRAAIEAVRQWRYTAPTSNGVPVRTWKAELFVFKR
jgi:TonB family protein